MEDRRDDGMPTAGGPGVPPPPEPAAPGQPEVTRPADYYSQPPVRTAEKKGCGKWAIGCGGAGCLFIILLVAGFWWLLQSGRFETMLVSELTGTVEHSAELDDAAKNELRDELQELQTRIDRDEVGLVDLQGLLQIMQTAITDESIDSDEAEDLLNELRRLNDEPIEQSF